MTRADMAIAALSDQMEQRIRIAAQLPAAYRIRAAIRAWDGTRCNLLVTDHGDAYGRQVADLARSRGTPVLAFGVDPIVAGISAIGESSLTPALAQAMRELLQPAAAQIEDTVIGGPQPALCRLTEPEFSGRAIDATCNGRTIHIRPEEGRVYAPTYSDLLSARDSFLTEGWTLNVTTSGRDAHGDGASRSLEAFLLQCAFSGRDHLPVFPMNRYRLKDWPDLGSAPELVEALKVARSLLRAPADPEDLRRRCGIDARDVNASLWAYRAANLLEVTDQNTKAPESTPPVGAFSGILARIAQRFGLVRA